MTSTIIACLVSFILGATGMGIYDHNQPAKTEINNEYITTHQYQAVDQKQMMISETSSGAMSLIVSTPRSNIIIELPKNSLNKTNYEYRFYSKTNTYKSNIHKTNIRGASDIFTKTIKNKFPLK